MKKITKKQINAELPRRDALRRAYILRGESGVVRDGARTFASAWVYVGEDGEVSFYDYGYGDGMHRKVVHPDGGAESYEVTDLVTEWLQYPENLSRQELVSGIYDMIRGV